MGGIWPAVPDIRDWDKWEAELAELEALVDYVEGEDR